MRPLVDPRSVTGAQQAPRDGQDAPGYVRRVRGERDRRTVTVEPVEDGMAAYHAARVMSERHLYEIQAHYTSEQVPLMIGMLTRVAGAYRSATRELREKSD
ncbi:hypothetical protein [Streptosporangium lutulentum]|uniref:Uncharacterized protein n=1 Tax=Streptosporangium lutulentum TaxID=1461250 RepID=A0ABT9QDT6_9ACTN|nr:hypothetical protein [Streptosporangium lutulentum]MDP9844935.1 hypothetical protein [Streptosporangium lutulentum]